jgi:acyl-CoA reductase-like NAD-dependent aldehyde dehydrogenase
MREAGLPAGVLNLVFHRSQDAAEITNTVIAHPAIKKINFTGSTAVGSIIAAAAGKHLKPIITELGGKASAIILADADIEKAAMACTVGAFLHAGQVCMAAERIIVHSSIAEAFTNVFKDCAEELYGSSGPAPRFVTAVGATKTKTLVKSALDKGAHVVLGDPEESREADTSSTTMRPIILSNIQSNSDLYHNERFRPSVALYTFEMEEEALHVANDTGYGPSGAVFTKDLAAGLRVANGYETGAVHINGMTIHDETNLPHGAMKKSGFGRFNGLLGLEEWVRSKVVMWKD